MNARELVERLTADITRDYPVLANGLLANQLANDDPLWEWADVAAEHVLQTTGYDDARIAEYAEAFVVFINCTYRPRLAFTAVRPLPNRS